MTSSLSVVPQSDEPLSVRVKRAQDRARALAGEHVGELDSVLEQVAQLCADISTGGASYPPGVRELCARLAVVAMFNRSTIASIQARIK